MTTMEDFVSRLAARPHIAEKIVKHLGPDDIDNCLETSRDFKLLMTTALKWNEKLQGDYEEAASRLAVTSGTLDFRQCSSLRRGFWDYKGNCASYAHSEYSTVVVSLSMLILCCCFCY